MSGNYVSKINGYSVKDKAALKVVLTAAELDAVLANATSQDVGTFYMYLGETTAAYKKGAVYQVEEE